MTRLRIVRAPLVALVSAAVVVGLGLPASAVHVALEVDWSSPGSDPAAGVVVEGTTAVEAGAGFDGGLLQSNVKEWQVQLRTESGGSVGVLCTRSYSGLGTGTAALDLTWDSRYAPSGTVNTECGPGESANVDSAHPLENGRYVLRVRAHDQLLITEWHHEDFAIRVNNRPSTPQGVSATFDETVQEIRVVWSANPESDLSGYLVQQCHTESKSQSCASSDWVTVAETASDDVDAVIGVGDAGAYRHRVLAHRPDWSQNGTLSSSAANAGSPIVLEGENGPGEDADTGPGDDGDSGPEVGSDVPTSALPEHVDNSDEGDSAPGNGGSERRRGPDPRLVQRDAFDPGFEDALPYGARSARDTPARAEGLLVGQEGAGNALVPIAGGLLVFVFSMQLRHLGRRASFAAAGDGPPAGPIAGEDHEGDAGESGSGSEPGGDDDSDHPPAFRPVLGGSSEGPGSFIANWRRWIPKG